MKGDSLHSQEDYIRQFGVKLKELRAQKGMSQEELANEADVSISQVQRIEYGDANPTLATIKVLADALNIQPSEMF